MVSLFILLQGPSKRQKVVQSNRVAKKYPIKLKKIKEKAADRGVIQIPSTGDHDDVELSEQDHEVLKVYGGAVSFLDNLDHKGISR
jgi:nucleolar complex protein 3